MKVKIIQDSIIFISEITSEEYEKARQFVPEALTLNKVDEDTKKKVPVCSLHYAAQGGINKNGIVFDSTTDNGNLCHTMLATEGFDPHVSAEDKVKVVSERYAGLILKMNELEVQIKAELEMKQSEIEAAKEAISTIDISAE